MPARRSTPRTPDLAIAPTRIVRGVRDVRGANGSPTCAVRVPTRCARRNPAGRATTPCRGADRRQGPGRAAHSESSVVQSQSVRSNVVQRIPETVVEVVVAKVPSTGAYARPVTSAPVPSADGDLETLLGAVDEPPEPRGRRVRREPRLRSTALRRARPRSHDSRRADERIDTRTGLDAGLSRSTSRRTRSSWTSA